MNSKSATNRPQVVIIGGGFGGLYAAQALKDAPVEITLIDKRNFHLFQPLLYQVATGGLSPGDITSPLRAVLKNQRNTTVLIAEMVDLDPEGRRIILRDGELGYDYLLIATGVSHHYFGHEGWAEHAPGLKTIEDALDIRRRILLAFEAAEREADPEKRRAWLTFAIVGGGPTGVELAGALAELANTTLKDDFKQIDPTTADILLLEGADRILPPYPPDLSAQAERALRNLGATVHTNTVVTDIGADYLVIKQGDQETHLPARTILWAAGVKASSLAQVLADRVEAELDRSGRIIVAPDLSVAGRTDLFVIGDLAHFAHQGGQPLPGVAQVAMQQGHYVANLIQARLQGQSLPPFHYTDKGSMAVVGRNAAVVDLGRLKFAGFPAWLAWIFIHIWFLIEFDNRIKVLLQWAWNYFTRKRGARLITGGDPFPLTAPRQDLHPAERSAAATGDTVKSPVEESLRRG